MLVWGMCNHGACSAALYPVAMKCVASLLKIIFFSRIDNSYLTSEHLVPL